MLFFLSTEVPRTAFEFMILAHGGKTLSDLDNFESDTYQISEITHVVSDRPAQSLTLDSRREFIQPQWVCDCINNCTLLPLRDYGPGKALPPHLSPFEENKEGDYMPDRLKQLKEIKGEDIEDDGEESSGEEDEEDPNDSEDDEEEKADYLEDEEEFEAEKEIKKAGKKVKKDKQEDNELKTAVLSKKLRRVLEKINYSKDRKSELVAKLKAKKKAVLKTKK